MAFSISVLDEEVLLLKSLSLCFFRAFINDEAKFTKEEAGKTNIMIMIYREDYKGVYEC